MLAERQVHEERRDERDVRPPHDEEGALEQVRVEATQRDRQHVRHHRAGDVSEPGRLPDLGEELRGHDAADHREDEERVPGVGEARRPGDQPALECPGDRGQDRHGHEVLRERDERPQHAIERDREHRLDEPAGHDVGRADREQDEAPEDARMHERGARVLEHLALGQRIRDHAADPPRDVGERP